jgi:Helicase HerA, central domain
MPKKSKTNVPPDGKMEAPVEEPKGPPVAETQAHRPLGFINFDGSTGDNAVVEFRVPFPDLGRVQRGQYVLIGVQNSNEAFLGRVTQGPFYTPDAVGKDSAFARTAILMANEVQFLPDYHGICRAEVLGRINLGDYSLAWFASRPFPKSQVLEMDPDRIAGLLNLDGNMYIGLLTGYEQIKVCLDSTSKKVLPRNVGIFGTVGSGKTNTSQVLIEEAITSGWAVVVLDVEGEYISMDNANAEVKKNKHLANAIKKFGISPRGLDKIQVYRCPGTESRRKDAREFCLRFGNLSAYQLSEIMGMNENQEMRFLELYDEVLAELKSGPKAKGASKKSKWDRFSGEPVVGIDPIPGLTLDLLADRLAARIKDTKGADRASWRKVQQLITNLQRYRIFESSKSLKGKYALDHKDILVPGLLSVFDLSDSTNVRINNIIIAEILRLIFTEKVRNEKAPPALVLIEEAHTFVSRENVKSMQATMDMLREISRRGRKRWLALGFISQQPSHLPNEIYELCNTKIVHQTTGQSNLDALKVSAGGVNEAVWSEVPLFGQGRALIVSPQFSHPVLCDIRPCLTNREHTD